MQVLPAEQLPPPVIIENLRLLANGSDFARSLVEQFGRFGRLSDKQWACARRMAHEHLTGGRKAPEAVKVGASLAPIVAMFDRARTHLKNPAILIGSEAGTLRLKIAGPNSRNAGQLFVMEKAGGFEDRRYFGRVDKEGEFHPARDAKGSEGEIAAALAAFAADPERVAADYGKLTGSCCFCNRALTDERSTSVGYGPICAENFGLAWGRA